MWLDEHIYLLTTTGRTCVQQSFVHHKRLLRMPVVRQCCPVYLYKITMWFKSYEHFH